MQIKGKPIDRETRCEHYHGPLDIIAIKFPCCNTYYPCHLCHEETAGHTASIRPAARFHEKSVLCGVCRHELTVHEYLSCGYRCPQCGAGFNPGCGKHAHYYFELPEG